MGLHKLEAIRCLPSATRRTCDDREIDAISGDFVARMMHYYEPDPTAGAIPGAAGILADLHHAGVKVALNTGFGRSIVDVILRRLTWTDVVDASDKAPRGPPHSDMIHILMAWLSIPRASNVAKVGDRPDDIEEGVNAVCGGVVGVTTGSFTRPQLDACPHARVVDSVADVPGIVFT